MILLISAEIENQIRQNLKSKLALGESKKSAIKNGTFKNKIFSLDTYHYYLRESISYCKWAVEKHNIKALEEGNKIEYINEYLVTRVTRQGKPWSAWSLKLVKSALEKLYNENDQIRSAVYCPPCKTENRTKSRLPTVRDRYLTDDKCKEIYEFAKGTGLRRSELTRLRGAESTKDILKKAKNIWYIHITNETKGHAHWVPILGDQAENIVFRIRTTAPGEKVWERIPTSMDIQSLRIDYARTLYKKYARQDFQIIDSERYYCKNENYGLIFDKPALKRVANAFGLIDWKYNELLKSYFF